jgi:hypothetical protein
MDNKKWYLKKRWIALMAPPAFALFIAIGGEVVMHLWNWLVPPLFGWRQVTFWQALGLLLLCRILFGGFGGGSSNRHEPKPKKPEQWEQMTPEEREKFRQGMRSRCGGFGETDSGTAGPA